MRVLDLFCGAGGASRGIVDAGHSVEGVDNNFDLQEHYPYKLLVTDAIHYLDFIIENLEFANHFEYDAFWASPPCQAYSWATTQWKNKGNEYPDLVDEVRQRLIKIGKPFDLENVINAPLRKDLMLCMSMFDDGREFMVRRHRIFEIHGFEVPQPEHVKHVGRIGDGRILTVFGHGGGKRYRHASSKIDDWQIAMGIDWTRKRKYIAEAIPPSYSKYIMSFLKDKE